MIPNRKRLAIICVHAIPMGANPGYDVVTLRRHGFAQGCETRSALESYAASCLTVGVYFYKIWVCLYTYLLDRGICSLTIG